MFKFKKRGREHDESMARADAMESRIEAKQREAERRDPVVKELVAELKLGGERNHFGEALKYSFELAMLNIAWTLLKTQNDQIALKKRKDDLVAGS